MAWQSFSAAPSPEKTVGLGAGITVIATLRPANLAFDAALVTKNEAIREYPVVIHLFRDDSTNFRWQNILSSYSGCYVRSGLFWGKEGNWLGWRFIAMAINPLPTSP